MAQAAEVLGVTVEAVRGRIKRGTLQAEREGDHVFVLLDTDQPRPDADQPPDRTVSAAEFIEEMRDRIHDLREQLASERRANEENRRIIAALTQRIPEIEPPEPREEPDTSPVHPERAEPAEPVDPRRAEPERVEPERVDPERVEPREPPEMHADEQQGRGPVPDAGGAQEGTERVPWWRRLFGG